MAQLVRLSRGKGDRVPAVINIAHLKETGAALTLGRCETCDVVLRSTAGGRGSLFSRVHATLTHVDGVYRIEDRSVNGTFVNNLRIAEASLRNGDILSFGTGGDLQVGQPLPTPPLVAYRFCDDEEAASPHSPNLTVGDPHGRVVCIAPQAEFIPTPPPGHSPSGHFDALDTTLHIASCSGPSVPNHSVPEGHFSPEPPKPASPLPPDDEFPTAEIPPPLAHCSFAPTTKLVDDDVCETLSEDVVGVPAITRPPTQEVHRLTPQPPEQCLAPSDVRSPHFVDPHLDGAVGAECTSDHLMQLTSASNPQAQQGSPIPTRAKSQKAMANAQLPFVGHTSQPTNLTPPQLGGHIQHEPFPTAASSFPLHQPSDFSGGTDSTQQPAVPTSQFPAPIDAPFGAPELAASTTSAALFESAGSSSLCPMPSGTEPPTASAGYGVEVDTTPISGPTDSPPMLVAATPSPIPKAGASATVSSVRCVPETPAADEEVVDGVCEVQEMPGCSVVCRKLEVQLEQQKSPTLLEPSDEMHLEDVEVAAAPVGIERLASDSSADHVPVLRPRSLKRSQPCGGPRPKQPKVEQGTKQDEEWLIADDEENAHWLITNSSEEEAEPATQSQPPHSVNDAPEGSCESSSSSIAHGRMDSRGVAAQIRKTSRPSHAAVESVWPANGLPTAKSTVRPATYVAAPRSAFAIFFAETKESLRASGQRGWTVATLREEINQRWAALRQEERGDYLVKEEREREHFERLSPGYQRKQSQPVPRRQRWKVGVGPVVPTEGRARSSPEPTTHHEQYRQRVTALHQQRLELEAKALARLQEEEGHYRANLPFGVEGTEPFEPSSQSQPRKRNRRPSGETCTIQDVEGYLQDHPVSSVPLTRRVLNAGHRPGDPVEVMPCKLAALLKPHQLEGVRFLWANAVVPAPMPASPCDATEVQKLAVVQGCILAHAMGLGKTLTSVAFTLMYLRHHKGRTVLVVAPKSTLHNWRQEFRQWAERAGLAPPRLWLLDDRVKGVQKRMELLRQWVAQGGVLIVGYALFVQLVGERSANPPPPGATSPKSARKRQRLDKSGVHRRSTGPHLSQSEVLIGDSDEDNPHVQDLVRASYACNEEDDQEDRQVLSEAVVAPPGEPLDDQAAAFRELLTVQAPDCLIVDEGHKLANPKSCLTQALNRVLTRQRIICTGTPIQNNLWEYFSMVDFVRPGYWGRREFAKLYTSTIRPGQAPSASPERLRQMEQRSRELYGELAKFVHRRDVGVLLRELPPIREFVIAVPLSQIQAKVYADFVAHGLKACKDKTKLQTRRILLLSAVLQKIGNHPDLARQYCIQKGVDPMDALELEEGIGRDEFSFTQQEREHHLLSRTHRDFSWARPLFVRAYRPLRVEYSAKMEALLEIIAHCMQLGEKVLVFSQWASTLDVIEALLQNLPPPAATGDAPRGDAFEDEGRWTLGREYLRFDGEASTTKRQAMMQHFNDPTSCSRLMLCCIKAGGLGINLPGATRVVLFDTSWNPQADQQAIYRAYRYGQTRPVFVYRLMNEGTIEQAIFQKTYSKVFLFRCIVDDDSLHWHRRELNNLRYVGPPPQSALRVDHRLLEEDPVLKKLFDRQLMCSVESHETLFASEDEQLLGPGPA